MARYTLFTQAARDDSNVAASSEELVNCYAEVAPGDARTRLAIRSVLGETEFATWPDGLLRAADAAGNYIYAISNGRLRRIASDGSVDDLGAVTDGANASISGNGSFVAIATGGTYRVWNGTSILSPVGGAIVNAGSVTFSDYDTIITELNGKRFEWTDTADPTTRNGLWFASAEGRDGNILRGIVDSSQLYLFCERHIEVWRSTGLSGSSRPSRYQRLAVVDIGRGLKGYNLVCRDAFGIFFVGNDGVAYIVSASQFQPVSTPAVNADIARGQATDCFYYEDQGHKFCVIRFSDRPAWCYDVTTQLWHRRQTGPDRDAWAARRIVRAWGNWHTVDDYGAANVLMRTNTDRGGVLKRIMRGKPIDMDGRKFSVSEWEFLCSVGTADLGRDAQVMLRVSWDGGQTWSDPQSTSLGNLGEYETQAKFFALGRGEQFTPEFSVTDEADIVLYSDARVKIR